MDSLKIYYNDDSLIVKSNFPIGEITLDSLKVVADKIDSYDVLMKLGFWGMLIILVVVATLYLIDK